MREHLLLILPILGVTTFLTMFQTYRKVVKMAEGTSIYPYLNLPVFILPYLLYHFIALEGFLLIIFQV